MKINVTYNVISATANIREISESKRMKQCIKFKLKIKPISRIIKSQKKKIIQSVTVINYLICLKRQLQNLIIHMDS